jgi:biopolymer transport protein ExbB
MPNMNKPLRSVLFRVLLLALIAGVFFAVARQSRAESEVAAPSVGLGSAEPGEARLADQPHFIPTTDLQKIIHDAGPLMYAILFCSFLLVAFLLERTVSLRRRRVIPKPFVTRFLQQLREGQLDRDEALKLCEENGSPVAQVFAEL